MAAKAYTHGIPLSMHTSIYIATGCFRRLTHIHAETRGHTYIYIYIYHSKRHSLFQDYLPLLLSSQHGLSSPNAEALSPEPA